MAVGSDDGSDDRSVTLIDTPSFGRVGMDDRQAFSSLTQYLEAHPSLRVIAMVYLHPMGQIKFDRAARHFLKIFQHLCGEHYFPNVMVVTTCWNRASKSWRSEWQASERKLCETKEYWGDMIKNGASCLRYYDTIESCNNIIKACLRKTGFDPPHFISELQKGITSDQIMQPILSELTDRPPVPLDAESQAKREKEVQRLRQDIEQNLEYYLEKWE